MTSKIMTSKEELSKKYQKKSDKQHVLDNPDTYIGSIENIECDAYIYDEDTKKIIQIQIKSIKLVFIFPIIFFYFIHFFS
jgi:DNA topoisomerase-2